jgi:hypothetical protein
MPQTHFEELENSHANPIDHILSKEFVDGVLKAGSLISMLENKKLNNAAFLSALLEKPNYQKFFTEVTSSENFKEAILSLLYLSPSLVKSKITKTIIRKLNAKPTIKPGKAFIQQTLGDIQKSKKQTFQVKK